MQESVSLSFFLFFLRSVHTLKIPLVCVCVCGVCVYNDYVRVQDIPAAPHSVWGPAPFGGPHHRIF